MGKEEEKELNFDDFVLQKSDFLDTSLDNTEESQEQEQEKAAQEEQDDKEDNSQEEKEISKEQEEQEEGEKKVADSSSEESQEEGEEVSYLPLIEMIHEANGWQDIYKQREGEFKENDSIDGLMNVIGEIISQNSAPKYASDATKAFDEFVSKYGEERAGEFLELNYGAVNYESFDISKVENQERIYRDYLKATTPFSDSKIDKEIKRLVDLEELEGEVEEAKKFLVEDTKRKAEELEISEKRKIEEAEAKWNAHVEEQKKKILNLEEIAEFKLEKKEREQFFDYLYKSDKSGKTPYQKDMEDNSDLKLALAYHAFKGTNKSKIAQIAETEAAKKLRESLSRKKDTKGKGTAAPRQQNPNGGADYNSWVLK